MSDREFFYADGRFFARLARNRPDSPVGVWELREMYRDMLPAGVRPVVILPADADRPSDTGETWQSRAVKAELAAADLRARLQAAEQRANLAESGERARFTAMRTAREKDVQTWKALQSRLLRLAWQVAGLYGREADLGRITVQCDGEHWDDSTCAEFDPKRCEPRSATPDELIDFIAETLRAEHPDRRYPQPSDDLVENGATAVIGALNTGGTLLDAVRSVLELAVLTAPAEEGHARR